MNWGTRILIAVTLTTITVLTVIVLRLPEKWLAVIGGAILLSFLLFVVAGLVYGCALVRIQYKIKRAEATKAELEIKDRNLKVIQDGFGMVYLVNLTTNVVENLTIYPGTHHNGTWEEPPAAAASAWHAVMGKRGSESPVTHLLPASVEPPIDLLRVMTQPTQSYAILGGQQQGKTYQAQLIAQYWQQQGLEVIVVGPKRDKGEWQGCIYYGDGFNWDHLLEGISRIREEALQRHQDQTTGHKQNTILPVFFDDWTKTRAELQEAESLILDATTLYASVNIVLYFILHLDTANAWGVGKVGAALKDNFIKLRIKPYYQGGMVVREKSTGLLIFPGDKNKKEVSLLKANSALIPVPDLVLRPTKEEQHLINLINAGITSRKQLSESVWGKGKYGKFYNDKIVAILRKWGLEVELL